MVGVAVAAILSFIGALKSKIEAKKAIEEVKKSNEKIATLESRTLDPFFERPLNFEQYATNLILIGEGGSGKTTIIHALSGANEAAPDVGTVNSVSYTLAHEMTVEKGGRLIRRLVRIYTEDYEGQKWTLGVKNESLRYRQNVIRSSTLIIVVDLVAPGTRDEPAQRVEHPVKARVREHLKNYQDNSIQTLVDLVGSGGQIILFINKIDLIYPGGDAAIDEAKVAFRSLIRRLTEIRGIKVHVLVGSAAVGTGIVGYDDGNEKLRSLFKFVVDHAEKVDVQRLKAAKDGNQAHALSQS